jgi:hypothetical protein
MGIVCLIVRSVGPRIREDYVTFNPSQTPLHGSLRIPP